MGNERLHSIQMSITGSSAGHGTVDVVACSERRPRFGRGGGKTGTCRVGSETSKDCLTPRGRLWRIRGRQSHFIVSHVNTATWRREDLGLHSLAGRAAVMVAVGKARWRSRHCASSSPSCTRTGTSSLDFSFSESPFAVAFPTMTQVHDGE